MQSSCDGGEVALGGVPHQHDRGRVAREAGSTAGSPGSVPSPARRRLGDGGAVVATCARGDGVWQGGGRGAVVDR